MGVYKEGKNWKVQVYYKDWQGNQKRKQKRGFRTKGEAKEWERDFLQQQSQGVDIEFGNFLEIYYKDMDVRLREHTMYTKRYIIDLKIRPYFEKKILSEITVADVRAWQNELLMYKDKNGKGYSQTYLKTINCQLTAIFNYATGRWRGMCLRTKHFLFAAVPVVSGSRPPIGRCPVRRNHQRPG